MIVAPVGGFHGDGHCHAALRDRFGDGNRRLFMRIRFQEDRQRQRLPVDKFQVLDETNEKRV